ncbi:MAG TPA: AMP-binding protein, partial [Alphaproteobacteria bacterium]|nr:AMP-binding protein [Alphaproteobacteria bacterium]
MSKPPFRDYAYAEPKVEVERRGDGSVILRSGYPLGTYEDHVLRYLERWNAQDPGRLFLAQRRPDRSWQTLSYGEAWRQARAVGQALLDRGLGPERPVMILSGNSIEHALMTLGAMMAGVPAAPVSPAYSLMSEDFGKLRHVRDLVDPGLVFVQDAGPFARALEALALTDVEVVAAKGEGTPLAELLAATPGAVLEAAYRRLGPDTVAKYLFTSGSTGLPKGVINTQRMMCANQVMAQTYVPPEPDEPTVIVDWLPWNHTFGGNMNFNGVMATGGT